MGRKKKNKNYFPDDTGHMVEWVGDHPIGTTMTNVVIEEQENDAVSDWFDEHVEVIGDTPDLTEGIKEQLKNHSKKILNKT